MKKSKFLTLALGLALALQLNYAQAEEFQEELTLAVGSTFDLDMDSEIDSYEYDKDMVEMRTINGRQVLVLTDTGDTLVTVNFKKDDGTTTPMVFKLHSLTAERYNEVTDDKGDVKPEYQKEYDTKAYAASHPEANTTEEAKPAAAKEAAPEAKPATATINNDKAKAKLAAAEGATAGTAAPETNATKETAPAANTATPATSNTTAPAQTIDPAATLGDYPENGSVASQVLYLVNVERVKNKLTPLTLDEQLTRGANTRSQEIVNNFAHYRPNNTMYNTVVPGSTAEEMAENLAAGKTDAQGVANFWLHVDSYRDNILNPSFTQMGLGHTFVANSAHQHYWVQLLR